MKRTVPIGQAGSVMAVGNQSTVPGRLQRAALTGASLLTLSHAVAAQDRTATYRMLDSARVRIVPVAAQQNEPATSSGARRVRVSIPPGPLEPALKALSGQTQLKLAYRTTLTENLTTQGVAGILEPMEALARILDGTGLTYRAAGPSTITLVNPRFVQMPVQTPGDAVVHLDELSVVGEGSDHVIGPIRGYVATRSAAGTKTDTPILETPRSVEVIGRKEIQDRAVTSIPEAVRYSPGVTTNAVGFDPRFDQISIRGFPVNTNGDFRDGLRQIQGQFFTFRTEPFGLERIDIIKGPDSVLYGQTTPGGIIDRISKRPTIEPIFESLSQIRSTNWFRQGIDFGGPIDDGKTLAYRVVGVGARGDTSYSSADDRLMIAPSLTWRPDERTNLTILALVQKDETDSNVAALNRVVNGQRRVFDIRASDPRYDHLKQDQYQIGYQFEHAFDDAWLIRQNARYGHIDGQARYLTASVSGGGFVGDVYRRGSFALEEKVDNAQVDTQLLGRFETGFLSHKVLAGLDYQSFSSKYGTGSLPASRIYDLNQYFPIYGRDGTTPAITTRTDVSLEQVGIYAQDQVKFGEGWNLLLALRQDWATRRNVNGFTRALVAEREDQALTYNAGLLYAFDNGVSPYVSYATSFLPATTRDAAGQLLVPSEGAQIEGGIKYQPPGSESLFTVAAYSLIQSNFTRFNPGCLCSVAIGEIDVLGAELGARINLLYDISLIASYTYTDARITKDVTATNVGNRPLVTPEHTASAWLDYTFRSGSLAGISAAIGVRFVGRSFADNANTLANPSYTLFDAAVRYDLGAANAQLKGLSLAINALNLADDKPSICNDGYCYLTQGRTVLGTLRYSW